jgi:hypothetical protein
MPNLSQEHTLQVPNTNNEGNIAIDQGGGGNRIEGGVLQFPSLTDSHSDDLTKRVPSGHDGAPPILGTLEEHKVCENISKDEIFVLLFSLGYFIIGWC